MIIVPDVNRAYIENGNTWMLYSDMCSEREWNENRLGLRLGGKVEKQLKGMSINYFMT